MMMWVGGISYPQFFSAARTRSRLSRTAASGRPTVWKWSSSHLDAGDVDFHFNNAGVDAINGGAESFVEHAELSTLTLLLCGIDSL